MPLGFRHGAGPRVLYPSLAATKGQATSAEIAQLEASIRPSTRKRSGWRKCSCRRNTRSCRGRCRLDSYGGFIALLPPGWATGRPLTGPLLWNSAVELLRMCWRVVVNENIWQRGNRHVCQRHPIRARQIPTRLDLVRCADERIANDHACKHVNACCGRRNVCRYGIQHIGMLRSVRSGARTNYHSVRIDSKCIT